MEGSNIGSTLNRKYSAQSEVAAKAAPPTHIVKYMSSNTPASERACYGIDEAQEFAVSLVERGEALPETITIYRDTGIRLRVRCEEGAPSPDPLRRVG